MDEQDIRWKQRFENFEKALAKLRDAIESQKNPSDLEREGIIQRFEFTHELSWKMMKDFLEYEGVKGLFASRSVTREAFSKGLISNGQRWMDMIESRNKTVHTYIEDILNKEYPVIVNDYLPLLEELYIKMKSLL